METCLIIEDSETVRYITAQLIEAHGYHTLQASTSREGLDVMIAAQPGIVFLDWDMPRFDALEFLRGLADEDIDVRPTVILSAMENNAEQFALARSAGAKYHIIKPYDRRDIEGVLDLIVLQEELYPRQEGSERKTA